MSWQDIALEELDAATENPKESQGALKPGMSAVPVPALVDIGRVMAHGAAKYGRHNFRETRVNASTYFDAVLRHLFAWWEGEDADPESGLPHLAHAAAGLTVVMDAGLQKKLNDDRPPPSPDGWLEALRRPKS